MRCESVNGRFRSPTGWLSQIGVPGPAPVPRESRDTRGGPWIPPRIGKLRLDRSDDRLSVDQNRPIFCRPRWRFRVARDDVLDRPAEECGPSVGVATWPTPYAMRISTTSESVQSPAKRCEAPAGARSPRTCAMSGSATSIVGPKAPATGRREDQRLGGRSSASY
jgi:hypothetical protein